MFLNEGIFILRIQRKFYAVLAKSGVETKGVTMRKMVKNLSEKA